MSKLSKLSKFKQNFTMLQYNYPVLSFNNSLNKPKQTPFDAKGSLDSEPTKKLIKMLQAAYCDEWVAAYQYSIENDYLNKLNYSGVISDKVYRNISEELIVHASEEFNHAKLIVPELIRLGSEPIYQMDMLQLTANKPLIIPEKDTANVLIQAIDSEENAIKTYTTIIDLVKDTNLCSKKFQDTLQFILDQEYEHRSDLDKLLKDFKDQETKGNK